MRGHACVRAQSRLTLWNPVVCSPPGSSVHRISQARKLERVAVSFFTDLPDAEAEPKSPVSPELAGDSPPPRPLGSAPWEGRRGVGPHPPVLSSP